MSKRDATALRRMAADLLRNVVGEQGLADAQRHDYLVSIVRQWQTYDGNAELYLPGKLAQFRLTATPKGWNVSSKALAGWVEASLRTWNVPLGSFADVMAQLNRGQSAVVATANGNLLRLWTDPRKHEHDSELLKDESAPPPPADGVLDLGELAARNMESRLGPPADADGRALLVEAVVRQWERYDDQACLFVGDEMQLALVRKTDPFGRGTGFYVAGTLGPFPITAALTDLGFAAEAVPEVVRRLNFSEELPYRDEHGEPWLLWYDVLERRLRCRPQEPVPDRDAIRDPTTPRPPFPLGRIQIEPAAAAALAAAGQTVAAYLRRHAAGDRGDVVDDGIAPLPHSMFSREGDRCSGYYTALGARLVVNTLPDRTCTVVSYIDPRIAHAFGRAAKLG